jgi:hypothetical protein
VSWTSAPLESLLNVDKLISLWKAKGLVVYKVSPTRVLCIAGTPHRRTFASGDWGRRLLNGCVCLSWSRRRR